MLRRSTGWRGARSIAAAATAGALLLAGCASGSGPGAADAGALDVGALGYIGDSDQRGEPQAGGTLTFGSYSFPSSLDPIQTQSAGTTGGSEMAAIYDVLVRHDSRSGEYVPQLAASLEPNEDGSVWRVGLAPGVTFSDGAELDSAAVRWSVERFAASTADVSQTWNNVVRSVQTPDPLTVEFHLDRPWRDFPVLLSIGPGMIVGEQSGVGADFTPVGAGPFAVKRFAPNEELALTAREDYHGGRPNLDTLRFVPAVGAHVQFDSLRSGQLDVAFLFHDPEVIGQADAAGVGGYRDLMGQGVLAVVNQREGRPAHDVRVRQAMALAIDPVAINDRSTEGLGIAGAALFPEQSRWHSGVAPLAADEDGARELLAQAKADGYDGKLTYVTVSEPKAEAAALAAQSMLNAVGFDVTLKHASSVTDLVRMLYVEHDFDIARAGLSLIDDAPYLRLYDALGSDSFSNAGGYQDAEMDALLDELLIAQSEEQAQDVIDGIQSRMNETVPHLVWGPAQVRVSWFDNVHGVERTVDNIMLFHDAYVTG